MSVLLCLLLLACSWHCLGHLEEAGPIVILPTDDIVGHLLTSRDGIKFAAYESIPYAAPPTGHLRWMPPAPVTPWEGVKNCTVEPPVCPQLDYFDNLAFIGQEDCLYLNIFHPVSQPPLFEVTRFIKKVYDNICHWHSPFLTMLNVQMY